MTVTPNPVCYKIADALGFRDGERDQVALKINAILVNENLIVAQTKSPPPPVAPPAVSRLTTDPADPDLTRGVDTRPTEQAKKYLVLPEEERKKGFVRPFRDVYRHRTCGSETMMGRALSETYARDPKFYGATWCMHCQMHKPVSEFNWLDGDVVGS